MQTRLLTRCGPESHEKENTKDMVSYLKNQFSTFVKDLSIYIYQYLFLGLQKS
jgi:hypothetical protein